MPLTLAGWEAPSRGSLSPARAVPSQAPEAFTPLVVCAPSKCSLVHGLLGCVELCGALTGLREARPSLHGRIELRWQRAPPSYLLPLTPTWRNLGYHQLFDAL